MELINAESILETERLLLEPLKQKHAIALYSLLHEQRIYQYIPQESPTSLEMLEQRYQKLETRLSPDGSEAWLNWAVYVKDCKAYIGYVEATILANRSGQIAYIAYIFSPLFWGQGYAYQACQHLILSLVQNYNLTTIVAEVDTRNSASIRLLKRLNFVNVETRKGVDFFKGSSSNEYVYCLNKHTLLDRHHN